MKLRIQHQNILNVANIESLEYFKKLAKWFIWRGKITPFHLCNQDFNIVTVFRTKILIDMAQGLLRRVYKMTHFLNSNKRPNFLSDPDISKLRLRVEKAFPESIDLTKVSFLLIDRFQCSLFQFYVFEFFTVVQNVGSFNKTKKISDSWERKISCSIWRNY